MNGNNPVLRLFFLATYSINFLMMTPKKDFCFMLLIFYLYTHICNKNSKQSTPIVYSHFELYFGTEKARAWGLFTDSVFVSYQALLILQASSSCLNDHSLTHNFHFQGVKTHFQLV